MKFIKTDIAVVAAGPAGLAAAAAALEGGADVCVFEKSNVSGGAANMGMGPFAVESHIQQRAMDPLTKEKAFEEYMEYNYWNVDAKIVRDYFFRSADTIEWLESMGVEFFGAMKNFPSSHQTWHVVKPEGGGMPGARCAGAMNKKIQEYCQEKGGHFYFETPVTDLIKTDGKITGLHAKAADGTEYEVEAKAVIVATGGFGTNPEMVKECTDYTLLKDMFTFMVPGVVGDGIKMVWDVGGMHGRMMMEKIQGNTIPGAATGEYPGFLCFMQGSPIAVNKYGYRVCNEIVMQNPSLHANIIDMQQDRSVFKILDDKMIKLFAKKGLEFPSEVFPGDPTIDFDERWTDAAEKFPDCAFVADSIEELAEKMGMDPEILTETVDTYNDYCEQNYDEDFFKPRKYLKPLDGKKFYGYRFSVGAYGSLGGIKTNHRYEVLDKEGKVIPGLYGAGNDANEIYNGTYCYYFPGNTMGFAINSGRFAGENAAEYISES